MQIKLLQIVWPYSKYLNTAVKYVLIEPRLREQETDCYRKLNEKPIEGDIITNSVIKGVTQREAREHQRTWLSSSPLETPPTEVGKVDVSRG